MDGVEAKAAGEGVTANVVVQLRELLALEHTRTLMFTVIAALLLANILGVGGWRRSIPRQDRGEAREGSDQSQAPSSDSPSFSPPSS
jgi:hypothetical protein